MYTCLASAVRDRQQKLQFATIMQHPWLPALRQVTRVEHSRRAGQDLAGVQADDRDHG